MGVKKKQHFCYIKWAIFAAGFLHFFFFCCFLLMHWKVWPSKVFKPVMKKAMLFVKGLQGFKTLARNQCDGPSSVSGLISRPEFLHCFPSMRLTEDREASWAGCQWFLWYSYMDLDRWLSCGIYLTCGSKVQLIFFFFFCRLSGQLWLRRWSRSSSNCRVGGSPSGSWWLGQRLVWCVSVYVNERLIVKRSVC